MSAPSASSAPPASASSSDTFYDALFGELLEITALQTGNLQDARTRVANMMLEMGFFPAANAADTRGVNKLRAYYETKGHSVDEALTLALQHVEEAEAKLEDPLAALDDEKADAELRDLVDPQPEMPLTGPNAVSAFDLNADDEKMMEIKVQAAVIAELTTPKDLRDSSGELNLLVQNALAAWYLTYTNYGDRYPQPEVGVAKPVVIELDTDPATMADYYPTPFDSSEHRRGRGHRYNPTFSELGSLGTTSRVLMGRRSTSEVIAISWRTNGYVGALSPMLVRNYAVTHEEPVLTTRVASSPNQEPAWVRNLRVAEPEFARLINLFLDPFNNWERLFPQQLDAYTGRQMQTYSGIHAGSVQGTFAGGLLHTCSSESKVHSLLLPTCSQPTLSGTAASSITLPRLRLSEVPQAGYLTSTCLCAHHAPVPFYDRIAHALMEGRDYKKPKEDCEDERDGCSHWYDISSERFVAASGAATVAQLTSDPDSRRFFRAAWSHTLHMFLQVARSLADVDQAIATRWRNTRRILVYPRNMRRESDADTSAFAQAAFAPTATAMDAEQPADQHDFLAPGFHELLSETLALVFCPPAMVFSDYSLEKEVPALQGQRNVSMVELVNGLRCEEAVLTSIVYWPQQDLTASPVDEDDDKAPSSELDMKRLAPFTAKRWSEAQNFGCMRGLQDLHYAASFDPKLPANQWVQDNLLWFFRPSAQLPKSFEGYVSETCPEVHALFAQRVGAYPFAPILASLLRTRAPKPEASRRAYYLFMAWWRHLFTPALGFMVQRFGWDEKTHAFLAPDAVVVQTAEGWDRTRDKDARKDAFANELQAHHQMMGAGVAMQAIPTLEDVDDFQLTSLLQNAPALESTLPFFGYYENEELMSLVRALCGFNLCADDHTLLPTPMRAVFGAICQLTIRQLQWMLSRAPARWDGGSVFGIPAAPDEAREEFAATEQKRSAAFKQAHDLRRDVFLECALSPDSFFHYAEVGFIEGFGATMRTSYPDTPDWAISGVLTTQTAQRVLDLEMNRMAAGVLDKCLLSPHAYQVFNQLRGISEQSMPRGVQWNGRVRMAHIHLDYSGLRGYPTTLVQGTQLNEEFVSLNSWTSYPTCTMSQGMPHTLLAIPFHVELEVDVQSLTFPSPASNTGAVIQRPFAHPLRNGQSRIRLHGVAGLFVLRASICPHERIAKPTGGGFDVWIYAHEQRNLKFTSAISGTPSDSHLPLSPVTPRDMVDLLIRATLTQPHTFAQLHGALKQQPWISTLRTQVFANLDAYFFRQSMLVSSPGLEGSLAWRTLKAWFQAPATEATTPAWRAALPSPPMLNASFNNNDEKNKQNAHYHITQKQQAHPMIDMTWWAARYVSQPRTQWLSSMNWKEYEAAMEVRRKVIQWTTRPRTVLLLMAHWMYLSICAHDRSALDNGSMMGNTPAYADGSVIPQTKEALRASMHERAIEVRRAIEQLAGANSAQVLGLLPLPSFFDALYEEHMHQGYRIDPTDSEAFLGATRPIAGTPLLRRQLHTIPHNPALFFIHQQLTCSFPRVWNIAREFFDAQRHDGLLPPLIDCPQLFSPDGYITGAVNWMHRAGNFALTPGSSYEITPAMNPFFLHVSMPEQCNCGFFETRKCPPEDEVAVADVEDADILANRLPAFRFGTQRTKNRYVHMWRVFGCFREIFFKHGNLSQPSVSICPGVAEQEADWERLTRDLFRPMSQLEKSGKKEARA